jgi:hypothetical protein
MHYCKTMVSDHIIAKITHGKLLESVATQQWSRMTLVEQLPIRFPREVHPWHVSVLERPYFSDPVYLFTYFSFLYSFLQFSLPILVLFSVVSFLRQPFLIRRFHSVHTIISLTVRDPSSWRCRSFHYNVCSWSGSALAYHAGNITACFYLDGKLCKLLPLMSVLSLTLTNFISSSRCW